jgi:transketolase
VRTAPRTSRSSRSRRSGSSRTCTSSARRTGSSAPRPGRTRSPARDGPTALVLSRQKLTPLPHPEGFETEKLLAGGYVLKERSDAEATIVGTGSEASLALDASVLLERDGRRLRLVSMPCLDAFWELPEEEREAIVPSDLPVAVVEAGVPDPWYRLAGRDGLVLGLERFGASAPAPVLAEKLGFTAETVARRIEGWLPEATD